MDNVTTTLAATAEIGTALSEGRELTLLYQGNNRRVIPLAHGVLKNGKEALLCYKVDIVYGGQVHSIRLYHMSKVTDVKIGGGSAPHSKRIDYYLTRHFKSIHSHA